MRAARRASDNGAVLARALPLLLLGVTVAGCHLLLGHAPARDAGSGSGSERVVPPGDAPLPGDRPRPGPELLPPRVDGGDPCLVSGCRECQPLHNPNCAQSCTAGECDDLPPDRDPFPTCNQVLFFDDFCDPTLAKWGTYSLEGGVAPLGVLVLEDDGKQGAYTRWVAAAVQGVALAELRIEKVSPAQRLDVVLGVDGAKTDELPTTSYRWCQLAYENGKLFLENVFKPVTGNEQKLSEPIDYAESDLILQSWLEGGIHHCRVVYPGGKLRKNSVPAQGLLVGSALTLGLFTDGTAAREVRLDWVRAFSP